MPPAKPVSKRRRLSLAPHSAADAASEPLGAADDGGDPTAEKDEEELALEASLFGNLAGAGHTPIGTRYSPGEEHDGEVGAGDELGFVIDTFGDGIGRSASDVEGEEGSDNEREAEEDQGEEEGSGRSSTEIAAVLDSLSVAKSSRSAWDDPDDERLTISLTGRKSEAGKGASRLRKLRESADEKDVGGREYELRLRKQFQKINPAPAWATKRRKDKRPASSFVSDEDEEEEVDEDGRVAAGDEDMAQLMRETGGIIRDGEGAGRRRGGRLAKGVLEVERLRNANQAAVSDSAITSVEFHPQVQVLLTAGMDKHLRLFHIDGNRNPLLSSILIPDLPIHSARFHPSGNSILLTGQRPFFYTYDLQSGRIARSSRGLWGTAHAGRHIGRSGGGGGGGDEERDLSKVRFSPDGSLVALASRRGYVHLMDWGSTSSSGAGAQMVGSIKMNSHVEDFAFANGGRELVTLSKDSEVYVWDVGSRRCVSRWRDDGGFGPTRLEVDPSGRYTAIGSTMGIVNMFDSVASPFTAPATASAGDAPLRKPNRAIDNLSTSISTMRFNHDSQVLAIASRAKKDALRMVHLPSLTIFSNWPTSGTPLGHVTSLDFSRESEYVAIGNQRGRVLLYGLRHFLGSA